MLMLIIDPHPVKPTVGIILNNMQVEIMHDNLTPATLYNVLSQCPVKHAIIEGQYLGPNANVAIQLAVARGKVEGILDIYKVPYDIVLPMHWKKYFKKDGAAMYTKVAKFLNSDNPHLADCYLMFLYYTQKTLGDIPQLRLIQGGKK